MLFSVQVVEVVELGGDQGRTTTTTKKSCVVRLAKLIMCDKIMETKEKEVNVKKMTDAEFVEEEMWVSDRAKETIGDLRVKKVARVDNL